VYGGAAAPSSCGSSRGSARRTFAQRRGGVGRSALLVPQGRWPGRSVAAVAVPAAEQHAPSGPSSRRDHERAGRLRSDCSPVPGRSLEQRARLPLVLGDTPTPDSGERSCPGSRRCEGLCCGRTVFVRHAGACGQAPVAMAVCPGAVKVAVRACAPRREPGPPRRTSSAARRRQHRGALGRSARHWSMTTITPEGRGVSVDVAGPPQRGGGPSWRRHLLCTARGQQFAAASARTSRCGPCAGLGGRGFTVRGEWRSRMTQRRRARIAFDPGGPVTVSF
jgi:hypothetical protein